MLPSPGASPSSEPTDRLAPSRPSDASRALFSGASLVSAATLGSRVLGFARDAATAAILGAGPLADALMAGNALPLIARRLLAEGAFNAAFIPGLAAAGQKNGAAGEIAAGRGTLVVLTLLLAVLAGVGALFMPQVIGFIAPGFEVAGERFDLAVICGRVALLYLPLAAAAAVFGGMANRAHLVLLPALAPVAANLVVIAILVWIVLEGFTGTGAAAVALAAATVIAGLAQLAVMVIAARGRPIAAGQKTSARKPRAFSSEVDPSSRKENATKQGVRVFPRFREKRKHSKTGADFTAAFSVLRAASPAFLFSALAQLRLMIAMALVSAAPGAVAAITYAQRLVDLPLGLVGASAGAVLVPMLVAKGHDEGRQTSRAALAAFALALPAGAGLAMLAEPIVATLYQRGSFTAEDTRATALLLTALAFSLPAQGLERVLSAAACAHGFTKAAERIALLSLAVCLLSGLAFLPLFGPLGVAWGVVVSSLVSLAILAGLLARGGLLALEGPIVRRAAGLLLAAGVMALLIHVAAGAWPPGPSGFAGLPRLMALVGVGLLSYGASAVLLSRAFRQPG